MRIIFMGTPEFAVPTLKKLMDVKEEILLVVTQPDRPKGRGLKLAPSPIKELALKHKLNVQTPESVKDPQFLEKLKALKPDLIVVVAYGKILPKELFAIPKHGCFNVHASLLPKYRGAAPIAYAILNGDKETGVTIMKINEKMDRGPIILQEKIKIDAEDTAGSLADKLAPLGAKLLLETLGQLKVGKVKYATQDENSATYAPLLKKEDGRIIWTKKAGQVYNHIKAMNPWPGAFSEINGQVLKVWKGVPAEGGFPRAEPGTMVEVGEEGIVAAAGEGQIKILEVQIPGSKKMEVREFLKGHKIQAQEVLV